MNLPLKKPWTATLAWLVLFSASAWTVFILLSAASSPPSKLRTPYASVREKSKSTTGMPKSEMNLKVDPVRASDLTSRARGLPAAPDVQQISPQAALERHREWAELEFEFMMLTRGRTLDPKEFGGSMVALAAFAMRLMLDPALKEKGEEKEKLTAEYKHTEDMQRKREILDRLKVLRDDMMGTFKSELKAEQASLGVTGTSSGGSAGGAGAAPPPPPEKPEQFQ